MRLHCPPSYYDVIGYLDPPPSYNEVLRVGGAVGGDPGDGAPTLAAYDNRITVDELPPPFAEVEPYKAPPVSPSHPRPRLSDFIQRSIFRLGFEQKLFARIEPTVY